jgi:hypothetical protein
VTIRICFIAVRVRGSYRELVHVSQNNHAAAVRGHGGEQLERRRDTEWVGVVCVVEHTHTAQLPS